MKTKIFTLIIAFIFTAIFLKAQVDVLDHNGGAGFYIGWSTAANQIVDIKNSANKSIKFWTDSIQRMIIDAKGAGPASGYVGIGTNFSSPVSRLHITQGSDSTCWFQMTGNITGSLASDGLRIGVLNVAGSPFDVQFRQQENAPIVIFANDTSNIVKERMRFTVGRGFPTTRTDVTKTTISYGNLNAPFTRPVAIFNLGENPAFQGTGDPGGQRQWMDVGTFGSLETDNFYYGLKRESQDHLDAVINWGDNFQAPDGADNLRFIFTAPLNLANTGVAGTAEGIEVARISALARMGIGNFTPFATGGGTGIQPRRRLEIYDEHYNALTPVAAPQLRLTYRVDSTFTDFQTTTIGDLYIHPVDTINRDRRVGINDPTPGNTLEINGTAGVSPELAGLRFTDLINTVTPVTNPTRGVLSVDNDGDVIWVRDSTFSGGNATICTPVMPADLNFITKWTSAAPQICRTTGIYEESTGNHNVGIGIPSITSPPITNFDAKLQVDGKILMTTNGGVFSNNGIYQYNNSNFPRRILAMYGLNNEGVIAVGMRAGNNDPSSSQCVFIGDSAGSHTASANFNVFVGAQAGRDYIGTGEPGANTFMGDRSGLLFTSGSANTLLGSGAGGALTGANRNDNTMVGTSAGANVASGNSNCYVGRSSGTFRSGDENVMLGVLANATGSGTTSYNRMALGAKASVACDSCAVIGNLSQRIGIGTVHPLDTISLTVDSRGHKIAAVFSGQVGIGLANTTNLPVVDSAQLSVFVTSGRSNAAYFNGDVYATGGYNPLDADLEMNVQQDTIQANFFDNLNVYSFDFDTVTYRQLNLPKTRQVGFLAGDIQAKAPQLVKNMHVPAQTDFMGVSHPAVDFSVVNTNGLIPYLVGAVQRERVRINILRAHLISLQAQINACCNTRTIDPDSGTNDFPINQTIDLASSDPILYQNQPNPFDNSTTIRYFISENSKQPKIIFQDETGRTINETAITELGQGSILINAASLNNGIYTYSLQIDGKIIDSKKMIRTK